jgi:ribose transport system substrate-binding protein
MSHPPERNARMPTPSPLVRGATALAILTLLVACGGGGGGEGDTAAGTGGDTATDAAGSGEAGGDDEPFNVSFANYTEAAPLFRVIHTNLDQVLMEQDTNVEVKWYDNAGDAARMLQNAQLMVSDNPDAIVMYPVSTATQGIGRIFEDSGIPCVSVNLDTEACEFLNIDNSALGVDTATIIGEIAAERGWDASNTTVLLGQNAAAGEQVNDCVRYFYSTIAPLLGMEEVDPDSITPETTRIGENAIQFDGGSQLQPSFEAVSGLLPSIPPDHNIILYTVNNDSTTGALRALQDAGRGGEDTLLIGGLGGDEVGIKALREDPRWVAEGDIFVAWWGQYAIAMAQALAEGIDPPEDVTALPQIVLTEETVDQYHEPDSVDVKQLPPLVPSNEYLREGGFLQVVGNIEGL